MVFCVEGGFGLQIGVLEVCIAIWGWKKTLWHAIYIYLYIYKSNFHAFSSVE